MKINDEIQGKTSSGKTVINNSLLGDLRKEKMTIIEDHIEIKIQSDLKEKFKASLKYDPNCISFFE